MDESWVPTRRIMLGVATPLLAVLAALGVGVVLLILAGADPVRAYSTLLLRPFSDLYGFTETLVKATPLLLVGLGEGQILIKALYRGAALLILDEPTAVLTPQEVDELFATVRQMADDGHALIFITHKLHEVFAISDRVTVPRDGRVVGRVETKDTSRSELARMMVGRGVIERWDKPPAQPGPVVLDVENLQCLSDRGVPALKGISLQVRAGEILGIAGVSGNGQRELAEVITGLRQATAGHVRLDGQDLTKRSPGKIIAAGLAFIPEERLKMGIIGNFSVAENVILETHAEPALTRGPFMNLEAIRQHTAQLIRDYDVRTPDLEAPARNLSGGNIQKLILARELSREPRLLVASQPTRGVDIGATEYIHHRLIEQRSQGTAILLISEDLDEILTLSDRVAVMYEGEIVGIVPANEANTEELGLMMAGAQRSEE